LRRAAWPHFSQSNGQQQIHTEMKVSNDFDQYKIRNRESFRYAREISKPFGHIDGILEWCKSELREDWRWQLVEMSTDKRPGRYVFYFDSERDYFAFTLYWQ
jgi:hypothetical protein